MKAVVKISLLAILFATIFAGVFSAEDVLTGGSGGSIPMTEAHKQELAALQAEVQTCNSQLAVMKSRASFVYDAVQNATASFEQAKAILLKAQQDALIIQGAIEQRQKDLDAQNINVERELRLIAAIRERVADLSASEEATQVKLLLDAIEKRLRDVVAGIETSIKQLQAQLSAKQTQIVQAQRLVTDAEAQLNASLAAKNATDDAIMLKAKACDTLSTNYAKRAAQIEQEIQLINGVFSKTKAPAGNPYAVGQFLANGQVFTFDGVDYKFPLPGDFKFMRTWDNTLNVYVRVNSNLKCSAVAVKSDGTAISVEEDNSVFINGAKSALPVRFDSIEVYSRWVANGTAIEVAFADDMRVRIVTIGGLKNVYVTIPRAKYYKNTVALAGVFDDIKGDDFFMSNHQVVIQDAVTAESISSFVRSWAVHPTKTPFVNAPSNASIPVTQEAINALLADATEQRAVFSNLNNLNNRNCYVTGDAHYVSFDGSKFSMLHVGDFKLVENTVGTFAVHVRNTPFGQGAATAAVAINLNGDIVELYADGPSILVNGRPVSNVDYAGIRLNRGGVITLMKDSVIRYEVQYPGGPVVNLYRFKTFWQVYVETQDARFLFDKTAEGTLCGSFDNNAQNDLTFQGTHFTDVNMFGDRIARTTRSLFTTTYTAPSNYVPIPVAQFTDDALKQQAFNTCMSLGFTGSDLEACVYDIWASGDMNQAQISDHARIELEEEIHRFIRTKPIVFMPMESAERTVTVADLSDSKLVGQCADGASVQGTYMTLQGGSMTVQGVKQPSDMATVLFWVNINSTIAGANVVSLSAASGPKLWQIKAQAVGNGFALTFSIGSVELNPVTVKANTWVYIAAEYKNGGYASININGARAAIKLDRSINVPVSNNNMLALGGQGFNALVKELRLYDFDLDLNQINFLYHIGDDDFSTVLAKLLSAQRKIASDKGASIEAIKKEEAACAASLAPLKANVDAAKANIDSTTARLAALTTSRDEAVQNQTAAIAEDARIAGLVKGQQEVCMNLATASAKKPAILNELTLVNKILSYLANVTHNREELSQATALLSALKAKLEAEYNALLANDQKLSQCQQALASLQTAKITAEAAIATATANVNNLNAEVSNQQNSLAALQSTFEVVRARYNDQVDACNAIVAREEATTRNFNELLANIQAKIDEILTTRQVQEVLNN